MEQQVAAAQEPHTLREEAPIEPQKEEVRPEDVPVGESDGDGDLHEEGTLRDEPPLPPPEEPDLVRHLSPFHGGSLNTPPEEGAAAAADPYELSELD